jgi:hypothetical protein
MGYYTQHKLKVIDGSNELIEELRADCREASYALENNGDCAEDCKWYEHESDMISFSKKHPSALFMLSGEGEENGDAWREYYRNGLRQVCKGEIIYPKFNPELLK